MKQVGLAFAALPHSLMTTKIILHVSLFSLQALHSNKTTIPGHANQYIIYTLKALYPFYEYT